MTNETQLTGSSKPVSLAIGYTLQAPGLVGVAEKMEKKTGVAARSAQSIDPFALALSNAKASQAAHFEFTILADRQAAPPATASRSARALTTPLPPAPGIEFTTPKPPARSKSIVLHTDEQGEMTWIWPHKTTTRKTYFQLPRGAAQPAATSQERGPIIAAMRRVVQVITWATDEIVGDMALYFAQQWEEKNRPYGFYYVQPGKFGGEVPWGRMGEGRSLLLLHGTFSTGDGAFAGLIYSDWLRKMNDYYGGRIFAFNHPSLHHSPEQNIQQFRKMLPPEVRNLQLDVVTHSRGGLVGRELSERFGAPEGQDKRVQVKRTVLVAGPNSGTILTDRQHWSSLIDAYTNLLVGLPDNAFTITLEGILTLIKIVGGGAVHGLPGLQAMLPSGDYVRMLNKAPKTGGSYYALAAQYVPNEEQFWEQTKKRMLVGALRKIFGEDSDMVVPTQGCYALQPQVAGFSIPQERYKVYGPGEDTHHLNFFQKEAVNKQLHDWLTA